MYILEDNFEFAIGGYINYGQTVQFVNQSNGYSLPPVRLHRCELTGAKLNTNDPISQLHRIALELVQPRNWY